MKNATTRGTDIIETRQTTDGQTDIKLPKSVNNESENGTHMLNLGQSQRRLGRQFGRSLFVVRGIRGRSVEIRAACRVVVITVGIVTFIFDGA